MNVKKFRIRSLLDSINVIVTPQIQNKNHRYITNFDGIIHEVVEGDFTRLQQVLLNIIANAILNNTEPEISAEDAILVQTVLEQAYVACAEGCYKQI